MVTKKMKLVRKVLNDYRKIDQQIRINELKAEGVGLLVEPNITASHQVDEDAIEVLEELKNTALTDEQANVVKVLSQYIGSAKLKYATYGRIAKLIEQAAGENDYDKSILKTFQKTLQEHSNEEYVKLTQTERIAMMRLVEREKARALVIQLKHKKEAIELALKAVRENSEDGYIILYDRNVRGRSVDEVKASFLARRGYILTEHEYSTLRAEAVDLFAECCSLVSTS